MLVRYSLAIIGALLVATLLLIVMPLLIQLSDIPMGQNDTIELPDFIHVKPDEAVARKAVKPPKPPKPEPQPEISKPKQAIGKVSTQKIKIAQVQPKVSINIQNGISLSPGDGEYLPIVKVAPNYPRSAQRRCLEGHVIVSFTVTKNGSVRDPVVVSSTSKLFENSAKKAALKFKYKPRTVDGKAVETPNVKNKITYKIEGCN